MKRGLSLMVLSLMLAATAVAAPLSGKVNFQQGDPLPQALIDFVSPSHRARAVTLDDGSYYVSDLPGGFYDVTITHRGKTYTFKQVDPRRNPIFTISD